MHASANGGEWTELVAHSGFAASPQGPLEARALVLRNAPRRAACSAALASSLLALPRDVCWREADFHACVDASFAHGPERAIVRLLASIVFARAHKLRARAG